MNEHRDQRTRGPRFVDRVLAASIEELAEKGFEAFSIPDVAIRAGANKTSIYRRWPTKAELVRCALEATMIATPSIMSPEAEWSGSATPSATAPGRRKRSGLRQRILSTLTAAARTAGSPAFRGAIRALFAYANSEEVAGIA